MTELLSAKGGKYPSRFVYVTERLHTLAKLWPYKLEVKYQDKTRAVWDSNISLWALHQRRPGFDERDPREKDVKVSEWLHLTAFLGTADNEVHIVHERCKRLHIQWTAMLAFHSFCRYVPMYLVSRNEIILQSIFWDIANTVDGVMDRGMESHTMIHEYFCQMHPELGTLQSNNTDVGTPNNPWPP